MSTYTAPIEAISLALKAMIEKEVVLIAPDDNPSVDINFDIPNAEFVSNLGSKPVINLYLYRLQEQLQTRYSEDFYKLANASNCKHRLARRPKFVELFYAITIWMRPHKQATLTEHNLMSRLIQGIGQYEVMPQLFIKPTGFIAAPYSIPLLLFGEDPQRSQSEFWSALGSTPKPVVPLSITVPVNIHDPIETPFVDRISRAFRAPGSDDSENKASEVVFFGNVSDASGKPANGVMVHITGIAPVNMEQQAQTTARGCYRFYDVKAGEYWYWIEDNSDPNQPKKTDKQRIHFEEDVNGQVEPIELNIQTHF